MENRRFFKEIEAGNEALDRLGSCNEAPTTKIFVEGNHEDRFTRYFNYHPEFDSPDFTIPSLLNLEGRGYKWIPYREYWSTNGVYFTHIPFGKMREISGKDICSKAEAVTTNTVVFGHCFSWDTEVLTPTGWCSPNKIDEHTMVATMNKKTRELEFQKITGFYQYDHYKELIHFKNNSMDLLVTEDHGMVAEGLNGKLLFPKAKDWNFNSKALVSLTEDRTCSLGVEDKNKLRLQVHCTTDGSQEKGKYWRWHFKKQRKIDNLTCLLADMGIKHSVSTSSEKESVKIYTGELSPLRS
jgi:hypothetical protein